MKKVFITVFHPFITKNILNTDVFKTLISSNLQIILLVPDAKRDFFEQIYKANNVFIEAIPNERLITLPKFKYFSRLSHLMVRSNYTTYKIHERLDKDRSAVGYLKFLFNTFANNIFPRLTFLHRRLRKRILDIQIDKVISLFNKYEPNLVFSTDAFDESDCLFQIEAKRRNIKLISMVRSWDNCYSKGLMRVVPDKLIVNNQTIKEEAVGIHHIPREDVVVLGSPQYDLFINKSREDKKEFFSKMKLDVDKKTILFAPAGKILSDTDGQIIEIFKIALDSYQFKYPVQFLIRNHPNHPADISMVEDRKDFIIEDPGKTFDRNNPKDNELTLSDNEHLANELYYSDVVVWVATTLGVDSMVFDKPQVVINFDGFENKPYFRSVRRYHDEDHMKKMLVLGGVSVANSDLSLVESINKYLDNPALDKGDRSEIRKQQFYKLDGMAGVRIAEFIMNELSRTK